MNDSQLEVIPPSALEAITRGEVDVQISTAHKFPRSMDVFKKRARDMATIDVDTAESCIYCRPVGMKDGKQQYAEGLSVRMAEIVGASYGNLRVGSMIVEQTDRYVITRGFAHDLESNFASTSEVKEATVTKKGEPFSEGMRAVIAKAALAKARRDATFQVVPKALCRPIERAARALIAGDAKGLEERRGLAEQWVNRLKIDAGRVWAALGIAGPTDLTSELLLTLTGIRNSIKDGDVSLDDAFPPIVTGAKVGKPEGAATGAPEKQKTVTEIAAEEAEKKRQQEQAKPPAEGATAAKPAEPEPKKSGPTVESLSKTLKAKARELQMGPSGLVAKLIEHKFLPEDSEFEKLTVDQIAEVLASWEEFKDKINNPSASA